MSTDPKTPHFWPNLTGKVAPEAELAVKMLFNSMQEHDQAIVALKGQLTAAVVAKTTVNQTVTAAAAATAAAGPGASSNLGLVNNQTGTAYLTTTTDNGALITLNNAAAVALTLNTSVMSGFVCFVENIGVGQATLTPNSGSINGGAAVVLSTGQSCFTVCDGVNWWAATDAQGAVNFVSVTHKFLTGYSAATGVFTAAQPVVGDVTGAAPLASPTFTGTVTQPAPAVLTAATTATTATAGAGTALPATPAGYLIVSLNGASYKVPYFAM